MARDTTGWRGTGAFAVKAERMCHSLDIDVLTVNQLFTGVETCHVQLFFSFFSCFSFACRACPLCTEPTDWQFLLVDSLSLASLHILPSHSTINQHGENTNCFLKRLEDIPLFNSSPFIALSCRSFTSVRLSCQRTILFIFDSDNI